MTRSSYRYLQSYNLPLLRMSMCCLMAAACCLHLYLFLLTLTPSCTLSGDQCQYLLGLKLLLLEQLVLQHTT